MRILIKFSSNVRKNILVELPAQMLINEVSPLLSKGKYSEAIAVCLSKGSLLKETDGFFHEQIKACAVLTEKNIHYDLMQ